MAKPVSTKLSLSVGPTFLATVAIPIPGGEFADVEFKFKYRTKEEYKEWVASIEKSDDIDVMMDIACGWDLDEPYDVASVTKMLQLYMGAALAALNKYMHELTGARQKNL